MFESQGYVVGWNWFIVVNFYVVFVCVVQCFVVLVVCFVVFGIYWMVSVEEGVMVLVLCFIGLNVIIEVGVVFGECVCIIGNSFVGVGVCIGDDMLFYVNVLIYYGCVVGVCCIVYSGVVIGVDGFGFVFDFGLQGGEWVKILQVGWVVIGDDVEIGLNIVIDCGVMVDMVVE